MLFVSIAAAVGIRPIVISAIMTAVVAVRVLTMLARLLAALPRFITATIVTAIAGVHHTCGERQCARN
jgi:hypothetical protein